MARAYRTQGAARDEINTLSERVPPGVKGVRFKVVKLMITWRQPR